MYDLVLSNTHRSVDVTGGLSKLITMFLHLPLLRLSPDNPSDASVMGIKAIFRIDTIDRFLQLVRSSKRTYFLLETLLPRLSTRWYKETMHSAVMTAGVGLKH